MRVTLELAVSVGQTFSTFRDLEDAIHETCKQNFVQFYRCDAKKIVPSVRKNRQKCYNPNIIYEKIKYACIYGGSKFTPPRRSPRMRSRAFRKRCGAFVRAVVTSDGQQLIINGICSTHNHPVQKKCEIKCKIIKAAIEENVQKIRVRIKSDNSSEDAKPIEFEEIFIAQKFKPHVSFTFRGLCAPVFNVFNKDLSVNVEVIPAYAKFLADNGIKGILVHGTTGEGPSMTLAERKLVTEEWVKAVKTTKQHLMVQVGGCPLPDVLELAKHAEEFGVDSILCLPELYFKPSTPQELINYLKLVGEVAPKTPLLYYHIPAWSGVNINMANFLNESVGKIPTFNGIKYTSNDLDGGAAALRANDGKYAVFLGADTLLAAAFTLGFDSAIATTFNIIPQYSVKILEAINNSKVDEARTIQKKLSTICSIITKNGAWVPTMKAAMNLIAPIKVGLARPPLRNLTSEHLNELRKTLTAEAVL